ncbi:hypothetical protein DB32_003979 [Sandaracinus amylolyticus]|uniref:Lipoprotein n=1 Tax=Sandaracinus amylolyticus TaxID=927083 RepID=A0A0F6W402_9BACT|nr:hypothetical protein DB32_003979 [Sandaracinus amylolyticus]
MWSALLFAISALVGCGSSMHAGSTAGGGDEQCGRCEAWNEADRVCVPCLGRDEPGSECVCGR